MRLLARVARVAVVLARSTGCIATQARRSRCTAARPGGEPPLTFPCVDRALATAKQAAEQAQPSARDLRTLQEALSVKPRLVHVSALPPDTRDDSFSPHLLRSRRRMRRGCDLSNHLPLRARQCQGGGWYTVEEQDQACSEHPHASGSSLRSTRRPAVRSYHSFKPHEWQLAFGMRGQPGPQRPKEPAQQRAASEPAPCADRRIVRIAESQLRLRDSCGVRSSGRKEKGPRTKQISGQKPTRRPWEGDTGSSNGEQRPHREHGSLRRPPPVR